MTRGADMRDPEAARVAEALLDRTGAAMLDDDFAAFAPCFALPNVVATPQGAREIPDAVALEEAFRAMSRFYRGFAPMRPVRQVEAALFDGPDTIRFAHASMIERDGTVLQGPMRVHSVLEHAPGGWRIRESFYNVAAESVHHAALLGPDCSPDRPVGEPETLGVYQSNLDAITRAYLENDFALLRSRVKLPLFKQGSAGPEVFATEAELRADFDRYMRLIRLNGITDLVRTVKSAERVGTRRIHGAYRTHVLGGAQLVMPSYISAVTLEQGDDLRWRMTSIMHPSEGMTLDRIVRDGGPSPDGGAA